MTPGTELSLFAWSGTIGSEEAVDRPLVELANSAEALVEAGIL